MEVIPVIDLMAGQVVRGVGGALPFASDSFDATMAVLTVHHWPDIAAGIAEMRRVSARQVIVSWDVDAFAEGFWFTRDYLHSVGPEEHKAADAALIAAQLRDGIVENLQRFQTQVESIEREVHVLEHDHFTRRHSHSDVRRRRAPAPV